MKKLNKAQINGKIPHVYGLEELILLICPYYPKPHIGSMQFLLNSNGTFIKILKNPKAC